MLGGRFGKTVGRGGTLRFSNTVGGGEISRKLEVAGGRSYNLIHQPLPLLNNIIWCFFLKVSKDIQRHSEMGIRLVLVRFITFTHLLKTVMTAKQNANMSKEHSAFP